MWIMRTLQSTITQQNVSPRTPAGRCLLTVPEAAGRLGISPKTAWAWLYARKIPVVRLSGRCVRIPSDAIERLIADCTLPARPEVQ